MIPRRLRTFVERRWPMAATLYRGVRDEVRMARQRAAMTPEGFMLVGDRSMQSGAFETEERRIISDLLDGCDVFVDIGANVGFYTCVARQQGRRVVAFEPLPANLRLLYRNLQLNGWDDVEVWPVALAAKPGTLTLYGASTAASLVKGWAGGSEAYGHTVSVATLDAVLDSRFHGRRMLIKMDVEGGEFDALQGAAATLSRTPSPTWLVEVMLTLNHPGPNERFLDTFDLFLDRGYRLETADRHRRRVVREELVEWTRAGLPPSIPHNWLFIPR